MYMYYVKYIIAAILAKCFYFQPKEEIVKMSENALCWKTVVKLYIAYSWKDSGTSNKAQTLLFLNINFCSVMCNF